MASSSASPAGRSASSLVLRHLYRSLLRAAKPFTFPSPNAVTLCCLLHRTGYDDSMTQEDWDEVVATDDNLTMINQHRQQTQIERSARLEQRGKLFRRLVREVVSGSPNGVQTMPLPTSVDTSRLQDIIRREFRDLPNSMSLPFDTTTRRDVAFAALRELNRKLSYYHSLKQTSPKILLPQQAALHVSPLPINCPSTYLRPGAFLLSHPLMIDSYFGKTVVCILDHKEDEGTYGLIVNRVSVKDGKNRKLRDALDLNLLPQRFEDVFGDAIVRDGGPVHVSLQMLYSYSPAEDEGYCDGVDMSDKNDDNDYNNKNPSSLCAIGGSVIPVITEADASAALYSDRATYFQGDIFKAMDAVENHKIDVDDISFFFGASQWSPGQLEHEMQRGYWIPCRGPPEIARTGICEHEPGPATTVPTSATSSSSKQKSPTSAPNVKAAAEQRPLADLWLSMLCACGEEEAKLGHLFQHPDERLWRENGMPCDLFDHERPHY